MKGKLKHLILVSIDDLRFDALGFEANKSYLKRYSLDHAPKTPQIDRFAREGVHFGACRSSAPFTPPSHGTMLTGQNPYRHGVRPFMRNQLNASSKTLFERFKDAGYAALASIDFVDIFRLTQICRGAELLPSRDDEAAIAAFKKNADAGKGVFLFCHVGDVHPPYGETFSPESPKDNEPFIEGYLELASKLGMKLTADEQKKIRQERGALLTLSNRIRIHAEEHQQAAGLNFPRYLAGINRYDSLRFARFFSRLEKLGLLDETLVVLTSDHGQAILETDFMASAPNRKFDHGECVAEEVTRVPLVFWSRAVELRKGGYGMPVSTADIAPTVLGIFNVPFGASEMDGINRRGLVLEKYGTGTEWQRAQSPSECYAEAWYHDRAVLSAYLKRCIAEGKMASPSYETRLHQQSVRSGAYKLIQTAGRRPALYNTDNDPWERQNLLDYHPFYEKWDFIPNYDVIARPLVARIQAVSEGAAQTAPVASSAGSAQTDVANLESRLRELGYVE